MSERPVHPIARLPEEWQAEVKRLGERPFRAAQVFRWIYVKGELDPRKMTDLPGNFRDKLAESATGLPEVGEVHRSADGTRKLVIDPRGGRARGVRADPDDPAMPMPMSPPATTT